MAAKMLVLGHDRDYYGVNASPECVADAVRKVFEGLQQASHGAAFLQYHADYVLIHSLEITESPHGGCSLLAWVQMLNSNSRLPAPA